MCKRKRIGYCFVYLLIVVFVFTDTGQSAQKKPTTVAELALYRGSDRQQILEEGARKEGKFTFYTTGILVASVRPVVDAFQKKYPFIKVEIWRATVDTLLSRLSEEYKAGKHAADTVECTQLALMILNKMGILQPYYSPNTVYIADDLLTRALSEGFLGAAFRVSGAGLGYNTKLISKEQLPKTYQDLLNPQLKGKMAIAGTDTGQNWMGTMLVNYGEDFVKQIATQNFDVHMVSARAVLDFIINGEYALSPTIFDGHTKTSKLQGAPVDWIPLEPVYVNLGEIALCKHSPHPHAAMLFIDFELSKEAAFLHEAGGFSSTRKDVPGVKNYKISYGARSAEEGLKVG